MVSSLLTEVLQGRLEDSALDLPNTGRRVARIYLEELLSSYAPGAEERLAATMTTFPAGKTQEMVVESCIPFSSVCAHHLMIFAGHAYVGYIPNKRLVGLSKIPRVIDFFSRKLQLQERLTTEVADYLVRVLGRPHSLIVMLEAEHHCMACRGVRKSGVVTTTSALRGRVLQNPSIKAEFLSIIGRHRT